MSYSEAITRNDLEAVLNEVLPSQSVDYVVEQDTSGGWTYRKWASGKLEAWAMSLNLGSKTPTTWVSPLRYNDSTVNYPTTLFNVEPSVIATSEGNQWWVVRADVQTSNIALRLATVASSAQTAVVSFYLVGTWK